MCDSFLYRLSQRICSHQPKVFAMTTTVPTLSFPLVQVRAPGDYDFPLMVTDRGDGQYQYKQLKPSYLKALSDNVASLSVSMGILNASRTQHNLAIAQLQVNTSTHLASHINPHQVTKAQVGLGLVDNYATATQQEVFEGKRNDLFVTASTLSGLLTQRTFSLTRPMDLRENVAFGTAAQRDTEDAAWVRNISLGNYAGQGFGIPFADTFTFGHHALATQSDMVQLGSPTATVFATQPIQYRADARDLTGVLDESLGLDFIMRLRPVTAQYDLREDYINYTGYPEQPGPITPPPTPPVLAPSDPGYQAALLAYKAAQDAYPAIQLAYTAAQTKYRRDRAAWLLANRLTAVTKNGSHVRVRRHHMFIASEVTQAAQASQAQGVDFAGYQDHTRSGGLDIETLATAELIPPMVKSIQDLYTYVRSDGFAERVATKLFAMMDKSGVPIVPPTERSLSSVIETTSLPDFQVSL